MRIIITILFVISLTTLGYSQKPVENPQYLAGKLQKGFIIPHSAAIEDISFTNPSGIMFSYGKIMLSEKGYKTINQFSKTGLSLYIYDYQYPEVLGHSFNLSIYGEPVFRFHKALYLSIKAGLGVSYLTKVYNAESNPGNKFFSTAISFILFAQLNINYKLNKQWHLSLNAAYPHISNGGIKQPNKGMNFPAFGLGAEYILSSYRLPDYSALKTDSFKSTFAYEGELFLCAKNINESENFEAKLLWLYGMQLRASRQISKLNSFSLAAEWIADNYDKERIKRAGLELSHHKAALMFGHELLFGQFSFRQQFAFYIFAPYETDIAYQRYTLSYALNKHLMISVSLKANKHVADIFDFRIGFRY
jgi:hypothetical protein